MNATRHALAIVAAIPACISLALPGCSGAVSQATPTVDAGDSGLGSNGGGSSGSNPAPGPFPPASDASTGTDASNLDDVTAPQPPSDGSTDAPSPPSCVADAPTSTPSDAQPPAQAFVYAVVEPGTNDSAVCGESGTVYEALGSASAPLPVPVADGGSTAIACRVDPACGGGFDIELQATAIGVNGASLSIAGHISPTGGTGLSAMFTQQGQTFASSNCTFTLTYNNSPLPAGGAPAPGRIWGHIDCPSAVVNGQYVMLSTGMVVPRACDAWADVMFENCQ